MLVVLGGGESGVGAAILAKVKGFEVFVSDYGTIKDSYKAELEKYEIPYEDNQHTEGSILAAKEVIKSPGIPDKAPIIKKIKAAGIPIIDEIEFGSRYTDAFIIGITGSNGKTTTTNLTYHLLKEAGFNVGIGGNIGYSFAKQVALTQRDYYVLELSSFQLDGIKDFCPNISILLNITADHLDRYEYKIENYINSKFRIILNQRSSDAFIWNAQDKNSLNWINGKTITPKLHPIHQHIFKGENLQIGETLFDTADLSIKGKHNLFNAACAVTAAKAVGVEDAVIEKAFATFQNSPHRLEVVRTINEVTYINDSKATNVDAVWYALDAMTKPTVWIVGGVDKGNDYSVLEELVTQKVKAIVCLGVDNSNILEAFSPIVKIIEETQSMEAAVKIASLYAESGDVVLLSPACASFDLFNNYIDRGEQFISEVRMQNVD